jgi:carbon storage regulator
MLVLSRRLDESVAVGGSTGFEHLLKVTVLEIRGGAVKLGFEINDSVPVHRWEIWERLLALSEDHDLKAAQAQSTVATVQADSPTNVDPLTTRRSGIPHYPE